MCGESGRGGWRSLFLCLTQGSFFGTRENGLCSCPREWIWVVVTENVIEGREDSVKIRRTVWSCWEVVFVRNSSN